MRVRVSRWGNSLALRIPKSVAAEVNLAEDSHVDLRVIDGQLVAIPEPEPAYTLESLLAGITDANLHADVDWGPPVGKEVW
jgi:antitoxin MazE